MYRLAITEAAHSGELGAALYEAGQLALTHAITGLFAQAAAHK
jgi:hypothetical protein